MLLDSPRLRELAGRAAEVARDRIAPAAEREDRDAVWPRDALAALGEAGLLGLTVPQDLGGHGQGLSGIVAISRVLARESPSTALCYAMHCVGTTVIAAKATPHQKTAYLEPIARGEHITTLALSEPGTGSEFWVPETTLRPSADGFVLSGRKSFVTNGGEADSYVVSSVVEAPDAAPAPEGAFTLVLLDANSPGLSWGEPWRGMGMRGNSSRDLLLSDARLPPEQLLGDIGDQLWYIFEIIAPLFLAAMAGTYLGIAEACLEEARSHLARRRQTHTGELLGQQPVLAHDLGRLWIDVEATRLLVESAAMRADSGDPDALVPILGAKIAASEAAVAVANRALTLCGGAAYRENSKLSRLLRDARAGPIMAPTSHALHVWIGRALVGLPLL